MKRTGIYLDSNAGAPLASRVVQRIAQFTSDSSPLANPSSIHQFGRKARRWVSEAREAVAASLGADPEQLIFTASGTESNQLAIRSVLEAALKRTPHPHWITTPVEHDCILALRPWFESRGGQVSLLPVDSSGAPTLSQLDRLKTPETVLLSLVWVNNETGVISDISAAQAWCRTNHVFLSLDACQAWGKLPISAPSLGAHFLSVSAHKIGGLAGTGALWVAAQKTFPFPLELSATVLGKQEKGRRGGSENTLGIIAAGAAAEALDVAAWRAQVPALTDRLEQKLRALISGLIVNGADAPRVGNTLNLSFEGIEGDGLVMALDLEGVAVSAGSACASGVLEPSHVLTAMGRTRGQAMAALRVSLHAGNTPEELDAFCEILSGVITRVRAAKAREISKELKSAEVRAS